MENQQIAQIDQIKNNQTAQVSTLYLNINDFNRARIVNESNQS